MKYDASLVVLFHGEGLIAHQTLTNVRAVVSTAKASDISVETVCVLDRPTAETARVVGAHELTRNGLVVEADFGDLSASRNAGIAASNGRYVGVLDGDDYCSENWVAAAVVYLKSRPARSSLIAHPEYVASFGAIEDFVQQVDQEDALFSESVMLTHNFWNSVSLAERSVYERFPYALNGSNQTGFGYEDWHWHCQTIAAGFVHKVVPGTASFYRRKTEGILHRDASGNAVIQPTALFEIGGKR